MSRPLGRVASVCTACVTSAALAVVACGSRTGLLVPTAYLVDAQAEDSGPLFEGGPIDASVGCTGPTYCDPSDQGYVWQCGTRIFQCSSLEQCEERESGAATQASCVNPCLDSLGNDTSNGCEFYAVEMDTTPDAAGVCYAVFVVNQWKSGEPAKIEVSLGGQDLPIEQFARIPVGHGTGIAYAPYDSTKGLARDQIAILFLSRDPAALTDPVSNDPRLLANCPAGVTPAVQGDSSLHGTGIAQAFHLKTNVPVVAYQMLPYGGGSARVTGSTLLMPTTAWDVNYVVANPYSAPTLFQEDRAGPTTVVVSSADGTNVTILPTVDVIAGPGVAGTTAATSATYSLQQGQYLQITQTSELTGSAIQSDKPVAIIAGSTLMDLPLDVFRADSAEQMLPPVRALGSEYVAARYRSRDPKAEESVPWRLVGVVDGTVLSYEPAAPVGAPLAIGSQEFVTFSDPGPFVVRSQDSAHPFYLASYMTGGEPYDGTGDPEFINVVPPAQYLPRYTFFTDPTYPETNLVVVRVRSAMTGQMPDVALDCAGTLGGWQAVGTSGLYEMTRVDLSTGDFQGVGACDNGVHSIASNPVDGLFGVTVWGWGNDITWPGSTMADESNPKFTRWVSYGYPAGANFKPLTTAVLPAH